MKKKHESKKGNKLAIECELKKRIINTNIVRRKINVKETTGNMNA
jgi:hypothetical protein